MGHEIMKRKEKKRLIQINYRDSRPIYEQIYDSLRMQIVKGFIGSDEKLPSVRELASELSINPNTIQRAIRTLEQDGYVYTVAGRGTFACKVEGETNPRIKELYQKMGEIIQELLDYGVSEEVIREEINKILKGGSEHDNS